MAVLVIDAASAHARAVAFRPPYANGASHTYYVAAGTPVTQQTQFIKAMAYLATATDMTTGSAASGSADVQLQAGVYTLHAW